MSESGANNLSHIKHTNHAFDDASLLEVIGRAYFGNSWKKSMALALSVDERRITHWLQSTRPVPVGVWSDLVLIGKTRQNEIMSVENLVLEKMRNLPTNS